MNDDHTTHFDAPDTDPSSMALPPPMPKSPDVVPDETGDHGGSGSRRKRRKWMFCFHCNRPEGHFVAFRGSWLYSFVTGMTFGLIKFVGPYKCQCCGKNRLMSSNFLNPKWHFKEAKNRTASRSSRSSGRRRKKSR
jgi:hypothetical protein